MQGVSGLALVWAAPRGVALTVFSGCDKISLLIGGHVILEIAGLDKMTGGIPGVLSGFFWRRGA